MKPFDQLAYRGQAKRLKKLAIKALDQFDFELSQIQLIGLFTNAIFRLRTTSGQNYILRVCRPNWRTESDLISEIMWLQALNRDTDIYVPEPVPTKDGSFFVESLVDGVPEARRCVVMGWMPGSLLATRLNEENIFKMGLLFARLHKHGADFVPPKGFTKRRMDSIYARDEPNVLFSEATKDAFTPETKDILCQTAKQVKEAFIQLYNDPLGIQVIHNDLHHENIKLYRGHLFPIDFEDTILGYPVQDIAMALQDLMVDVSPEEYEAYQSAFQEGYERIKSWPEGYEGQIDTFRVGRMLWVANYVARYQSNYLPDHVAWLARLFERYLESGYLRRA